MLPGHLEFSVASVIAPHTVLPRPPCRGPPLPPPVASASAPPRSRLLQPIRSCARDDWVFHKWFARERWGCLLCPFSWKGEYLIPTCCCVLVFCFVSEPVCVSLSVAVSRRCKLPVPPHPRLRFFFCWLRRLTTHYAGSFIHFTTPPLLHPIVFADWGELTVNFSAENTLTARSTNSLSQEWSWWVEGNRRMFCSLRWLKMFIPTFRSRCYSSIAHRSRQTGNGYQRGSDLFCL